MKFGQSIREEGPQSHMKKTGTPTMGGLTFLISIIITSIIAIFFVDNSNPIILLLFVTIGFGLIGFIDDYIIVVKKNNQGLTSEISSTNCNCSCILLLSDVFHLVEFSTNLNIPFTNISIPLSFAYVIFIVLASWILKCCEFNRWFRWLSNRTINHWFYNVRHYELCFRFTSNWSILYYNDFCIIRFLPYNLNPAKVFMGDTGSLALGGIFATISIMLNQELSLLLIGLVFVIETASVMLQVASYKLTKTYL